MQIPETMAADAAESRCRRQQPRKQAGAKFQRKMRTSNLNRLLRHTAPHRFLLLCLPFSASCSRRLRPGAPAPSCRHAPYWFYLAGDNNPRKSAAHRNCSGKAGKDTGSKCPYLLRRTASSPKLFHTEHPAFRFSSVPPETVEELSGRELLFGRKGRPRTADVVRKKFAGSYFNYIDTRNGAYRSATQSIVYTREMDALAILAGKTTGNTHGRWDDALLGKLQHFDRPGSYGDIPARPRYFDFGQYMAYLAPERQADLDALLRKTVVWKAATPEFMAGYNGFTILTHSGLTTYIEQDVLLELNAAYKKTACGKQRMCRSNITGRPQRRQNRRKQVKELTPAVKNIFYPNNF